MSGESVFKYLKGHTTGTMRLAENHQLTNLVMGVVGRLVIECVNRRKPLEGIQVEKPKFVDGVTMVAQVRWSQIAVTGRTPAFISGKFGHVKDFMLAKASGLSRACARNPDLVRFINAVLEKAEGYGKQTGIQFKKIRISSAILDSEDRLVVRFAAKEWL